MDERGPLPHEEAIRLLRLAHDGDEEALDELVRRNTALVRSIVRRFAGRAEYDDLFQIGCLGLVKAIRRFDPSFDVRFSTYAVPMISGEIKRFLRDDGAVKVSRTLKELACRAAAERERLTFELGREPSVSELAEALGATVEDVAAALEASRPCVSIYEPAYNSDSDALVMDTVPARDNETDDALNRVLLKELLSALSPRERKLIMLRFFEDKTQTETAELLGISQVQVSRLESRLLLMMRGLLQDRPAAL